MSAPAFPELITIDEEIRGIQLQLENPGIGTRYINHLKQRLEELLENRRKLLEGIKKRT